MGSIPIWGTVYTYRVHYMYKEYIVNNIRNLIRARRDHTPVVPVPNNMVPTQAHVTTTPRVAMPTNAWFDAR